MNVKEKCSMIIKVMTDMKIKRSRTIIVAYNSNKNRLISAHLPTFVIVQKQKSVNWLLKKKNVQVIEKTPVSFREPLL